MKRLLLLALFFLLARSFFAENTHAAPALPAQSPSGSSLKTNVFAPLGLVAKPSQMFVLRRGIEPDPIEFASNTALWIAPNPATSFLTVGLRFDEETTTTVEILDLVGRSLQRETHCLREGSITFSVADLPKGVFLVRVTEGGKVKWTRRFQKV